jgi:hypothetical protein
MNCEIITFNKLYIYIYDTPFTTNDEPNVMKGVGVLTNCESIVIESETL